MNEVLVKDKKIEDMIYEIRGRQIMLDSDLAKLYQCKNGTKEINQAVNRNIDRFPSDFYFQLTNEEYNNLKSQIVTSSTKSNHGGIRKLPYVFTEQGVAMLATIIKTSIAAKISIDIMRAFIAMRHYIGNNEYRLSNVEAKVLDHDKSIKLLQEVFDKFDDKQNEIYFNGQEFDAYSRVIDIFKRTKKELIIIDAYADNTVLDIIKRLNIKVIIITRKNKLLTDQDIVKYNKQYNNLKVVFDSTYHDRYFIIDRKKVYHCGASVNHIGNRTLSINLLTDKEPSELLIKNVKRLINYEEL